MRFPWWRGEAPAAQESVLQRSFPLETLKRVARILVIDDDDQAFPLEAARRSGFSVDHWPKIDAARLAILDRGEYDIIFLDIKGVAEPGISETGDGLGILRHLKKRNPRQVVVAFSGDSYDMGSLAFYRQADDQLPKPIAATTAIERLEALVQECLSVQGRWETMRVLMEQAAIPEQTIAAVRGTIETAKKGDVASATQQVRQLLGDVANGAALIELARKLLELVA